MAICLVALIVAGCQHERRTADLAEFNQTDSLEKIIAQKDNEINDLMATMNEIQEGLREISEAENRVTVMKNGEGANKAQQIREDLQFISNTMKRNRELVEKLRQQLRESSVKGDQFKKTIDNLIGQLDEKDQQIAQLRQELNDRNMHINQLDNTISSLNNDVQNLTNESKQKSETISTQDKQLNTAWYVFGTRKELKEQHIIEGDKVLQSSFNKNYFTKIDIRVDREIKLYSKSAKVLTMHPSSSYTLQKDANKQYVLRITNPDIFWSTSKYLVILVK